MCARSHFLHIFEVREEPQPISTLKDDERERRARVRKGTEAVEGEVEMDASGEGFVNMGSVKVNRIRLPLCLVSRCHYPTPPNNISSPCWWYHAIVSFVANAVLTIHVTLAYKPAWSRDPTYSQTLLLHTRTSASWNCHRDGTCENSELTRRRLG